MNKTRSRLGHIRTAIAHINALLRDKTDLDVRNDPVTRAALERFLEIISEASRHVPQEMKDQYPQQPWRSIADIGNALRHTYHRIESGILWSVYENDLPSLETVIEEMIQRLHD